MTDAETDDAIRFFFAHPTTPLDEHLREGRGSVLYVLRRELLETMGYDPNVDTEEKADAGGAKNRLFASLILMFTVVDLLAKFQIEYKPGKVGERFKDFLQSPDGGDLDKASADLFYAVRNSLVHAFGVPDSAQLSKLGLSGAAILQRRAAVSSLTGLMVVERRGPMALVYIDGVFRMVMSTMGRYRQSLHRPGSDDARRTFMTAFADYGRIYIGTH